MFELAKKKSNSQYKAFGLRENPFHIAPLFKNFKNLNQCQGHEKLFVPPKDLEPQIPILTTMKNRRMLAYGCYGVGKTSFVDSLLYLGYNYHKRFCLRTIITEENIDKAINELLLSLCFEIVEEITNRSMSQPVSYLKKWAMRRQHHDNLMENIARLVGNYTEIEEKVTKKKRRGSYKLQPAAVGIGYDVDTEIEIRKSIQSYIEVLPMRTIGRYLEQFLNIVLQMGFEDIVIFIDEADHISQVNRFIKMLTRSREVLFSEGYTFLVSGSPEVAHHTESIGSIFDKTIFIGPADFLSFKSILERRIRVSNASVGVDIFTADALSAIYETSKGIRKQFLRLAENALDIAAIESANKVEKEHVSMATYHSQDRIASSLKANEYKVLQSLVSLGSSSPSNKELQKKTGFTRSTLAKSLKKLAEENYVVRKKQGRQVLYSISSLYLPYFEKAK